MALCSAIPDLLLLHSIKLAAPSPARGLLAESSVLRAETWSNSRHGTLPVISRHLLLQTRPHLYFPYYFFLTSTVRWGTQFAYCSALRSSRLRFGVRLVISSTLSAYVPSPRTRPDHTTGLDVVRPGKQGHPKMAVRLASVSSHAPRATRPCLLARSPSLRGCEVCVPRLRGLSVLVPGSRPAHGTALASVPDRTVQWVTLLPVWPTGGLTG